MFGVLVGFWGLVLCGLVWCCGRGGFAIVGVVLLLFARLGFCV